MMADTVAVTGPIMIEHFHPGVVAGTSPAVTLLSHHLPHHHTSSLTSQAEVEIVIFRELLSLEKILEI